jgi:hypothetical protein
MATNEDVDNAITELLQNLKNDRVDLYNELSKYLKINDKDKVVALLQGLSSRITNIISDIPFEKSFEDSICLKLVSSEKLLIDVWQFYVKQMVSDGFDFTEEQLARVQTELLDCFN